MGPGDRRRCNEPNRASEVSSGREPERAALAGDAGLFRGHGAASGKRDAELRAISAGTVGAGMRTAAGQSRPQAAARLGVTAGEVAGELRFEAIAGESEPAAQGIAGRKLLGTQGELAGFWQSRRGQESLAVCHCTGVNLNASPKDQVHDLCAAGAGSAGGETGTAIAPGDQKAG